MLLLISFIGLISLCQVRVAHGNTCSTTCKVTKNPPTYDSDHLGIGNNMNDVHLPDDIPENDFVCYKHNWCKSGGCKLIPRPTTGPGCNWNLITVEDSNPSLPAVHVQTPKHSCSSKNKYWNKLFCVYNISLPACATSGSGGVRIEFNENDVKIKENDYAQIIHSNGKMEKVTGDYNDLTANQKEVELSTTNFLVAFFTDKTGKDEGFSLITQCRT